MEQSLIKELEDGAWQLRERAIEMIYKAGSGHPGGSLSEAEIISVLYFHHLNLDPSKPDWENRDRFILSKGHSCPTLYAALAIRGFFPIEELNRLRKFGSILQGHPDMQRTPGIDISTGSLGQGLSAGVGMALGACLLGSESRIYVLLGCGELQEGQVWEAAMAASHYCLGNLVAIIDYNRLQIDGTNDMVMKIEPLVKKWEAFGWYVQVIDGHSVPEILISLDKASQHRDCPSVIIAKTIKGRGVSFMENNVEWHGKPLTQEEMKQALAELRERRY